MPGSEAVHAEVIIRSTPIILNIMLHPLWKKGLGSLDVVCGYYVFDRCCILTILPIFCIIFLT